MQQTYHKMFAKCVVILLFVVFLVRLCQAQLLIEGDILIDSTSDILQTTQSVRSKRAATSEKDRIWDNAVVPYVIDRQIGFTLKQKNTIREAMRHWETYTCIKFVKRDVNIHVNYINFTRKDCGCCSYVGRRGNAGQEVSIGKNCDVKGVIVHEVGHAIGFYHEHTRPDRDEYVQILTKNILPGNEDNFNKLLPNDVDTLGEAYDYNSIMHYGRATFSKNSFELSTIVPKKGRNGRVPRIGQRERLSLLDIRKANKLYKCSRCGRQYFDQKGAFAAPGFFNGTTNRAIRCEWQITVSPGERIELNIRDLDIFTSDDCKGDYLEVRDGYWQQSPLLGRFCGTSNSTLLMSNGNRMIINYFSSHTKHRGFAVSYEAICGGNVTMVNGYSKIVSPNYPSVYPPNKQCIWRIIAPPNNQIVLEFEAMDLEVHAKCQNDFLQVLDGGNATLPLTRKMCGNEANVPQRLTVNSSDVYIRFLSNGFNEGKGFALRLHQKIDECTHTAHGCEQDCVNRLRGYECRCRVGYKLRSDQKTCEVACGGIIRSTTGVIQSPLYPNAYPANEECIWKIVSQQRDHRITLNFTDFNLEGNLLMWDQCDYDSVSVSSLFGDRKIAPLEHGTFCSERLPKSVTSNTNIMQIRFKSDKSVQKSGFSATFTTSIDRCATRNGGCQHICRNTIDAIQCSCKSGFVLHSNGMNCVAGGCLHEITTPLGVIMSQNYPENYDKNLHCIWHFKAIHGHRPYLEFLKFDLEDDFDCTNDNVTVYINIEPSKRDFLFGDTFTLGTFCGSNNNLDTLHAPRPIASPADDLFMSFHTDGSIQRRGFLIKHSTICGGNFVATQTKKYIYSHARFGDTFYDHNTTCEWVIAAENKKQRIHLKFEEFDLEPDNECVNDYVDLYEKRGNGWAMYGRYCGSKINVEVVATRKLLLRFSSDGSERRKGFYVSYSIASKQTISEFKNNSKRFTRLKKRKIA